MKRLVDWIREHRWKALAGCVALLSGYLVVVVVGTRVADAYTLLGAWRKQHIRNSMAAYSEAAAQRLSARKRQLQQRFAELYVRLPRSEQMSTVVQVLQQGADTAGVTLLELRPDEQVEHAQYAELPVEVRLRGVFHDVGRFIHRVEQSTAIIKVQTLELQRASGASDRVEARLMLHMITLKESSGHPDPSDEPGEVVPPSALGLYRPGSALAYDAGFHDSFVLPPALFSAGPARARKPVRSPAPSPSPPFLLSGIVGTTALLRQPDGAVHIVRSGERVAEAQILAVRSNHVVVRFDGRVSMLYLHR